MVLVTSQKLYIVMHWEVFSNLPGRNSFIWVGLMIPKQEDEQPWVSSFQRKNTYIKDLFGCPCNHHVISGPELWLHGLKKIFVFYGKQHQFLRFVYRQAFWPFVSRPQGLHTSAFSRLYDFLQPKDL